MEEISKLAKAYYEASSDDSRKLIRDFFEAMDSNGDGKISIQEYSQCMKDVYADQSTSWSFFNQLDLDRNGTLDFFEVMTIFYICTSGRPNCDCCKKFITSAFFSCVRCYFNPTGDSYDLCPDCYSTKKCYHTHNGLSSFLDNYALLRAMKELKVNELTSPETSSSTVTRNASVSRLQQVATTFGTLSSAANIANIVAESSACSIM